MEKSICVTHCNPLNPAQTWSGKGRRPAWLNALDWRNQTNARDIAAKLYGNRWLTPAEFQAIRDSVTVTEKQEELPGLPPPPKKRGRPATGKAKTAAQRKADSRARMFDVVRWGSLDEVDAWIAAASPRQLLEAYPVMLDAQPLIAVDIAKRLQYIAADKSA